MAHLAFPAAVRFRFIIEGLCKRKYKSFEFISEGHASINQWTYLPTEKKPNLLASNNNMHSRKH